MSSPSYTKFLLTRKAAMEDLRASRDAAIAARTSKKRSSSDAFEEDLLLSDTAADADKDEMPSTIANMRRPTKKPKTTVLVSPKRKSSSPQARIPQRKLTPQKSVEWRRELDQAAREKKVLEKAMSKAMAPKVGSEAWYRVQRIEAKRVASLKSLGVFFGCKIAEEKAGVKVGGGGEKVPQKRVQQPTPPMSPPQFGGAPKGTTRFQEKHRLQRAIAPFAKMI